jgi:hypothetical protein
MTDTTGMLVLTRRDVEALLDLDALIDALAAAMADLSAGRASVPDRVAALVPGQAAFLAAMPGYLPSPDVLMAKLVSLFPRNAGTGLPTHQAVIAVFDPGTGAPAALLDGTAITAARTGACSALSARLLAREDAAVLAILGTGVQARSHASAMCRVRPIRGQEPGQGCGPGRRVVRCAAGGGRGGALLPRGAGGRRHRLRGHPHGRAGHPALLALPRYPHHIGGLQPGGPGDR